MTRFKRTLHCAVYGLCVSLSLSAASRGAAPPAGTPGDYPARRNISAIALPANGADGQTSWIIEPDVPRIPVIGGLNPQLPPHIERRLSYAFDLAQRGATFSAGAEFREVLRLCALELDARDGGSRRREALHAAWLAVDEADDFHASRGELPNAQDTRNLAAGHRTPVLNLGTFGAADSILAVQAYYAFAEERFAYSCQGLPGASLAYYGLGRTFIVPGTEIPQAAGKAALLQRAALAIAPQNVLARNELGVLLAEHGQLVEAQKQFEQCLAAKQSPETWRNLAVVYARQGDRPASRSALETAEALEAKERGVTQTATNLTGDAGQSAETTQKPKFWTNFGLSRLREAIWR